MNCCNNIIATNAGGIPRIVSTNTIVGTENVNIALGFRRIQPAGYFTVIVDTVIPADATTTLPINLTLNDTTRPLTFANGTPVTAAELLNVSMFTVYNDRSRGLLVLTSRTIA